MLNHHPVQRLREGASTNTPRRGILKRFLVFISSLGAFSLSPMRLRAASERIQVLAGYPTPTYLPSGYSYVTAYLDQQPDGFGGLTEKIISYWGGGGELRIAISQDPQHAFGGTRDHAPASTELLRMKSGTTVEAQYWDGYWRLDENGARTASHGYRYTWVTSDIHSIVFQLGGSRIGIRARRKAGVSLEELIKVASSFE